MSKETLKMRIITNNTVSALTRGWKTIWTWYRFDVGDEHFILSTVPTTSNLAREKRKKKVFSLFQIDLVTFHKLSQNDQLTTTCLQTFGWRFMSLHLLVRFSITALSLKDVMLCSICRRWGEFVLASPVCLSHIWFCGSTSVMLNALVTLLWYVQFVSGRIYGIDRRGSPVLCCSSDAFDPVITYHVILHCRITRDQSDSMPNPCFRFDCATLKVSIWCMWHTQDHVQTVSRSVWWHWQPYYES